MHVLADLDLQFCKTRAPDKMQNKKNLLIFVLFLHKDLCCEYTLEVPQWGSSNEYPQHKFSLRNKKNIHMDISLFQGSEVCTFVR